MNQKPNYGNWVPEKLLYLTFGGAALFLVLALLAGLAFSNTPLAVICAILCAVLLAFGIYMYACHECFAFGKGDMMAKVHAHLVAHLNWDGHGTLLDIGCGAAPARLRWNRRVRPIPWRRASDASVRRFLRQTTNLPRKDARKTACRSRCPDAGQRLSPARTRHLP